MLKYLCYICLLVASLQCLAQNGRDTRGITDIQQTNTAQTGVNRALIIGISKYKNIRQLNYATSDAILLKSMLVENKSMGFSNDNVSMLLDSQATASNIFKELRRILGISQANDHLLVYFAGHGDVETDLELGFLLAYNCEPEVYSGSDAVELGTLQKYIDAYAKKQVKVMLITDACHSGNLAGGTAGTKGTMENLDAMFKNVTKILACQGVELSEEKSFSKNGDGHGIFTYYLVAGFSGLADDDGDNRVSLDELESYIKREVRKETEGRQHPKVDGDLNQIVAQVDPDVKTKMKDFLANNANNGVIEKMVASRGIGESFLDKLPAPSKTLYQRFADHIKNNQLIANNQNNAYADYQQAVKLNNDPKLTQFLSDELEAALEDDVQQWLNDYLHGQLNQYLAPQAQYFDDAAKKLDVALTLLDKNDLRRNQIMAKKCFFEATTILIKRKQADYKNGIKLLEQADSLYPKQAYVYNMLSNFYAALPKPDFQQAMAYVDKTISLSPKWAYPYQNKADLYSGMHQYHQALEWYNKVMGFESHYTCKACTYNSMGLIYDHLDKNDTALIYFNKALAIDPKFKLAYNNIGFIYKKEAATAGHELDEEAIDNFNKAIAIDSTFITAYLNIGDIEADKGNMDKALAQYNKCIKIDPTNTDPYLRAADWYANKKQYKTALEYLDKANKASPNNAEVITAIGSAYFYQKNLDKAIYYLNQSLAIDSGYDETWICLGDIYFSKGDCSNAIKCYKTAHEVGTENDYLEKDLSKLSKIALFMQQLNTDYDTTVKVIGKINNTSNWGDLLKNPQDQDLVEAKRTADKDIKKDFENVRKYHDFFAKYSACVVMDDKDAQKQLGYYFETLSALNNNINSFYLSIAMYLADKDDHKWDSLKSEAEKEGNNAGERADRLQEIEDKLASLTTEE